MKGTLDHPPRPLRQASHSDVVTSVAFSPDGADPRQRELGRDHQALGRPRREAQARADAPRGVGRGRGGRVRARSGAVAGLGTGWDGAPFGAVTVWAPGAGRGRPLLRVSGKLDAIAFSPDGATLATAERRLAAR